MHQLTRQFTARTARLTTAALLLAFLALGAAGTMGTPSALAVCQPCHVPSPTQDDEPFEPIDWSLYDDIDRDDSSNEAEHPDDCLDYERQMCVAEEEASDAEDNMCRIDASYEDGSDGEDMMSSADQNMCTSQ